MENKYLRIGTTYYKIVQMPLASCDKIESLILWSLDCIKKDNKLDTAMAGILIESLSEEQKKELISTSLKAVTSEIIQSLNKDRLLT